MNTIKKTARAITSPTGIVIILLIWILLTLSSIKGELENLSYIEANVSNIELDIFTLESTLNDIKIDIQYIRNNWP